MTSRAFRRTFLKAQQLLIDHGYEFDVEHADSKQVEQGITRVDLNVTNNPANPSQILIQSAGPSKQLAQVIETEFERDAGGTSWRGYDDGDGNYLVNIGIDWNDRGQLCVRIEEQGESWLKRHGYLESFKAFLSKDGIKRLS